MSLSYMYGFPSLRMSETERLRQEERYRPHSRIFRLPNLGSHAYQQRHNKLIAYTVQAYHGEYQDYRRSIKNQHGFIDFLNVVNLHEPSRSGKSQLALELDRKYDREPLMLKPKFTHQNYPKAPSDGDLFLEAMGYRTRVPNDWYPQLRVSDFANDDNPIENKLRDFNLETLRVVGRRMRGSGKSLSLAGIGMQAAAGVRWYDEALRFKLQPHQEAVVEQFKQRPRGIYAFD